MSGGRSCDDYRGHSDVVKVREVPVFVSVEESPGPVSQAGVLERRTESMEKIMDPIQQFKDNVDRLKQIRDLVQNKLVIDCSRLVGLKTLLRAVGEARVADLEVGKMSVTWWKDSMESDMDSIDHGVKTVNIAILNCWNNAVEKMNQAIEINVKPVPETPFKEKIDEVEAVLMSISAMRSRMQGAVSLLRKALEEVQRPDTLLHLGLHTVTHCGLALEELPRTLR